MKKLKRTLAIVCVAAMVLSLSACGDGVSTKEFEWPTTGLATMLPEPTTLRGEIVQNADSWFSADISKITEDDYDEYVEACKDNGFTVDVEEGDVTFHAFNEDGYILGLAYHSDEDYFEINFYEPWFEAGETFSWPAIGLATLLPEPASNVGKINSDSSDYFSVYVGESTIDDYNNYIDACAAAGFTVDYYRSETYFNAKNEAGVSLSISYEGFNTFYIDITAFGVDLESSNGEEDEENIEEEGAEEDLGEEEKAEEVEEAPASDNVEEEAPMEESEDTAAEPEDTSSDDSASVAGVSEEFKSAMDSYEDFFDDYVAFMKKYNESSDPTSMLSDLNDYMAKYSETMDKLNALEGDMTSEELKYYTEVMERINKKLEEVT